MTVAQRPRGSAFRAAFPLIESKLHPPMPAHGTVRRTRLVRQLEQQDGPAIAAVLAPPGYGKTTLLAQWAAAERRPVAWLTVDDQDNDSVVLVSYLATALGRIGHVPQAVASGLAGPSGAVLSSAIPRLASALHAWPAPAVIVLDDVHHLRDQSCLDAVATLIDHLPGGFRMAIAGRMEPALPLARYRANRRLLELGTAELALDEDETAQLVAGAGVEMTREQAAELARRAEGWAAGVYLTSVGIGAGDGSVVHPAAGIHPHVAAYLRSEVGQTLRDDDLRLLARTSVLETVTAPVAAVLAETDDAGERLARLRRSNLLIVELSGVEPVYRYHRLLRDFLAAELERREPGSTVDLHRAAAAWYQEAGSPDLAVEHAQAAGDRELVAAIVAEAGLSVHHLGRISTLDRWLEWFEPADFHRYPPLALIGAWIHGLTGHADAADRLADIVEATSYDGPSRIGTASFTSGRALLRSAMSRNGPADALEQATYALAHEPATSRWRASALMMQGFAHMMLGELEAANEALVAASDAARVVTPATRMTSLAVRASLAIRRRDWAAAAGYAEASRVQQEEARYGGFVSCLLVHAVSARVHVHRGVLDRARDELVMAQRVRPLASHGLSSLSVHGLLELARAYLAVSDRAGAQLCLREAEAIVRRRPALGILTDEVLELRRRLADAALELGGATTLTSAELRVLPFLPTYLSFQDIADRLVISRNTVKSHAMSIYGKLMASSRAEAVERAVELGLLEPYPGLTGPPPTLPPDR